MLNLMDEHEHQLVRIKMQLHNKHLFGLIYTHIQRKIQLLLVNEASLVSAEFQLMKFEEISL